MQHKTEHPHDLIYDVDDLSDEEDKCIMKDNENQMQAMFGANPL
jgi:hypothetical protein